MEIAAKDLAATVPLGRCVISSGRLSHMIGVAYGITMDVPGFERELVEMKYLTAGHQISANLSESLRTRHGRSRNVH